MSNFVAQVEVDKKRYGIDKVGNMYGLDTKSGRVSANLMYDNALKAVVRKKYTDEKTIGVRGNEVKAYKWEPTKFSGFMLVEEPLKDVRKQEMIKQRDDFERVGRAYIASMANNSKPLITTQEPETMTVSTNEEDETPQQVVDRLIFRGSVVKQKLNLRARRDAFEKVRKSLDKVYEKQMVNSRVNEIVEVYSDSPKKGQVRNVYELQNPWKVADVNDGTLYYYDEEQGDVYDFFTKVLKRGYTYDEQRGTIVVKPEGWTPPDIFGSVDIEEYRKYGREYIENKKKREKEQIYKDLGMQQQEEEDEEDEYYDEQFMEEKGIEYTVKVDGMQYYMDKDRNLYDAFTKKSSGKILGKTNVILEPIQLKGVRYYLDKEYNLYDYQTQELIQGKKLDKAGRIVEIK